MDNVVVNKKGDKKRK